MPDDSRGVVYLVGAGPGDPGLLTVRARELIRSCDALVHDALVSPELLAIELAAREREPEVHDVGKRGGGRSTPQEEIEALLVRLARDGKRVVRLKGGDPMVFGRGGEEAQRLAREGIPFEIVPGVTAGVAAAAYAGIPVTHRGVATSVTFVTGHEDPARQASGTDWQALARAGGTIVLYMGVGRLAPITEALVAGGLPSDTPAAAIEWGTYPRQRTVVATLDSIYEHARAAEIGAPAITIIGDVVRLRREIAWFDRRPLFGRRIVVTRARAQASGLAERLRALGADVLEAPAIRIERLDDAAARGRLTRPRAFDWLVVTSANAVAILWDAVRGAGLDARALAGVRVAAVGPATGAALESHGIVPDVVPGRFTAEGLIDVLSTRGDVRGARVLYARAEGARDVLPVALRELGADVEEVTLYRSVPDERGAERLCRAVDAREVDLVTFTSASTARHFARAVGADRAATVVGASIGPITSEAARAEGIPVRIEAAVSTIDGLVQAIVAHARAKDGAP